MATLADSKSFRGIDPALMIDFDYYSDRRYREQGGIPQAMATLRDEAPDLFWSTALGGYWVVQGHEAIVDAAVRTDLFSSGYMRIPARPDLPEPPLNVPLQLDPPNHAAYRAPLNAVFTPSQMYKRVDQIRALAVELIEAIAPLGEADFFDTVAEKLPVLIFIDIMGLERGHFREYRDMAKAAASEPDQEIRLKAVQAGSDLLAQVIAERRANPRDDLISYLLDLEIEGELVSDDRVLGYCKLLFFAGLDTVANAMSFIVHYLAKDQELQARLRREPEKIPHAMEEMIRRHAVAPVVRIIAKDEDWRGMPLRKGDMALLNYPVANIDPRVFDHPDTVDIDRERINHIAFGSGPHRCLGRHLARIEIVAMLEELLSRLPTFRLAPDAKVPMRGGGVLTIESLPLVWAAGQPAL